MKAQPAVASIFCLCLVLVTSAAFAAEGLGKGQANVFFGLLLSTFVIVANGCSGAGPVPTARSGRGAVRAGGGRAGLAALPSFRRTPPPVDFKDEGSL